MKYAREHMQSEQSELRTRASQFDEYARLVARMVDTVESGSMQQSALIAAAASLAIRAAQARYDAKQLAEVEAELTRFGQ